MTAPCNPGQCKAVKWHRWDDHSRDCTKCNGEGRRAYGSGATWRGGMGTASMEVDQCDACWGSGSESRPWPNVRELEKAAKDQVLRNELSGFAAHCNMTLNRAADGLTELLSVIEAQGRRRKLPDGVEPFWYQRTVEGFAAQLRRYLEASK